MYKITGSQGKGYKLKRLGGCGLWLTVSKHRSKQRAEEAMQREEDKDIMKLFNRGKI